MDFFFCCFKKLHSILSDDAFEKRASLIKFYFLFVHHFIIIIVPNKSKKSSDTSGKPKPRPGIFDEQDQKEKSLLFQHKKRDFIHPLSCVED